MAKPVSGWLLITAFYKEYIPPKQVADRIWRHMQAEGNMPGDCGRSYRILKHSDTDLTPRTVGVVCMVPSTDIRADMEAAKGISLPPQVKETMIQIVLSSCWIAVLEERTTEQLDRMFQEGDGDAIKV